MLLPKHSFGYTMPESLSVHLKRQNRIKASIFNIINALAVNIQLEKLLEALLPKVIEGTRSNWGAFYIVSSVINKLEIKASLDFLRMYIRNLIFPLRRVYRAGGTKQ